MQGPDGIEGKMTGCILWIRKEPLYFKALFRNWRRALKKKGKTYKVNLCHSRYLVSSNGNYDQHGQHYMAKRSFS
jgi:hypothetical protein